MRLVRRVRPDWKENPGGFNGPENVRNNFAQKKITAKKIPEKKFPGKNPETIRKNPGRDAGKNVSGRGEPGPGRYSGTATPASSSAFSSRLFLHAFAVPGIAQDTYGQRIYLVG